MTFLGSVTVQAASIENTFLLRNVTDSQLKTFKLTQHKWYVILGTYAQNNKGYKAAKKLRNKLLKRGYDVMLKNSDSYEGLEDELVVVIMGPFQYQKQATIKRNAIKHIIREAYIKRLLCKD